MKHDYKKYKYIAKDPHGDWYAYDQKPEISENYPQWKDGSIKSIKLDFDYVIQLRKVGLNVDTNWTDSVHVVKPHCNPVLVELIHDNVNGNDYTTYKYIAKDLDTNWYAFTEKPQIITYRNQWETEGTSFALSNKNVQYLVDLGLDVSKSWDDSLHVYKTGAGVTRVVSIPALDTDYKIFKYIAMDSDGDWYAYSEKPTAVYGFPHKEWKVSKTCHLSGRIRPEDMRELQKLGLNNDKVWNESLQVLNEVTMRINHVVEFESHIQILFKRKSELEELIKVASYKNESLTQKSKELEINLTNIKSMIVQNIERVEKAELELKKVNSQLDSFAKNKERQELESLMNQKMKEIAEIQIKLQNLKQ